MVLIHSGGGSNIDMGGGGGGRDVAKSFEQS